LDQTSLQLKESKYCQNKWKPFQQIILKILKKISTPIPMKASLEKCFNFPSSDFFSSMAPPDPILGISAAFKVDKDPKKVNLSIGAYRDEKGNTFLLRAVEKVEKMMANEKLNKVPCSLF
jgi:hypothetical protein